MSHSNCDTCSMRHFILTSQKTGETFKPRCKTYTCNHSGKHHAKKLEKGILKWMKDWKHIRMVTLTFSSNTYSNPEEHYKIMQEAWRYFIITLRRNKLFTKKEQDVQYCRTVEFHNSGYIHYHILVDRFLLHSKIRAIWEAAIETVSGLDGSRCGLHIEKVKGRKLAAQYVAKYVTKAAHEKKFRIRLWSKSGKVAIFEKRKSDGEWIMTRDYPSFSDFQEEFPPLLVNLNHNFTANADPPISLFNDSESDFSAKSVLSDSKNSEKPIGKQPRM